MGEITRCEEWGFLATLLAVTLGRSEKGENVDDIGSKRETLKDRERKKDKNQIDTSNYFFSHIRCQIKCHSNIFVKILNEIRLVSDIMYF